MRFIRRTNLLDRIPFCFENTFFGMRLGASWSTGAPFRHFWVFKEVLVGATTLL